ncbi:Nif11-like leader peptide family natural product precursor (plasmid) [Nostoc sp. UHCC 0926]|uniref:Nif11-like leader peptide family natural product precursor n=1 Tax=Nostoc sp. UHCC 0926 TaxID=3025190 RepID=UPI00235FC7B5|nr:Nif11-like leader peptide family natural product precursor [Nostoc sp. UHCC 0926]WDD36985.1 Nif11-like leader peptide family natural product precursor [Nostoc sp. UHCC 0926]
MSVEAVNQFLKKVAQDEKLQQELAKVLETQNNDRVDATELGAKYGYQFSADEFSQEIQRRQGEFQQRQQQENLSDRELEAVAGGTTPTLLLAGGFLTGKILGGG